MKDIFLIWTAPWWTACRSITRHGRKALARAGAPDRVFLADEFYSCGGKSANDVVRFLNERYGMHMDAASTAADKRRIYLEMLEEEGMQPIREVVEFVHSLGDAPKAIATGSAMPGASRTLAARRTFRSL